MEAELEQMLAQAQGSRGRGDTTVPDKYVLE